VTNVKSSSFDVLSDLDKKLGQVSLADAGRRVRLISGVAWIAPDVVAIQWVNNGTLRTFDVRSLRDAYEAISQALTACLVAVATGCGFQGPVAVAQDGRRFSILGTEGEPGSQFFGFVGRTIQEAT